MDYQISYQQKADYVNGGLDTLLRSRDSHPTVLSAMRYSLEAGGKRLRPILFLSAFELASSHAQHQGSKIEADMDSVLPMACALEMIHTYSLIHDDLPAMDNDDYRRGKPTNHKVFGEAMAILAGDGLLNLAYEVMLENVPVSSKRQAGYLKAMSVIARSAGISGMIGGQGADIENQGGSNDKDILDYIHTHKTEALISGALQAGSLVCLESPEIFQAVTGYGKALGLAFQITDDILDLTGNSSQLGKTTGKDQKLGKQTYPAGYGLQESIRLAEQYVNEAVSCLQGFGREAEFLRLLSFSILNRKQ